LIFSGSWDATIGVFSAAARAQRNDRKHAVGHTSTGGGPLKQLKLHAHKVFLSGVDDDDDDDTDDDDDDDV
jgi:hypothetical protein